MFMYYLHGMESILGAEGTVFFNCKFISLSFIFSFVGLHILGSPPRHLLSPEFTPLPSGKPSCCGLGSACSEIRMAAFPCADRAAAWKPRSGEGRLWSRSTGREGAQALSHAVPLANTAECRKLNTGQRNRVTLSVYGSHVGPTPALGDSVGTQRAHTRARPSVCGVS